MARTILSESNLPLNFWRKAIFMSNHLQNRLPTKENEKMPCELRTDRQPNLIYNKLFGCKALTYINKARRQKLDK